MTRILLALLLATTQLRAQEPLPQNFQDFVKSQAKQLRAEDAPPESLAQWQTQRAKLRQQLELAWGGFPADPCPLDPQSYGVLKREGYRVEKLTIQTLPGVRMTANAYVPDKPGRVPAVLCVHGHWKGAKQDPAVQARCIGLVKLGFFVLCVDAFGAGERAIGTALGEYHGEMVGASLLTIGKPLSGVQVYENRRAVDYLLTRPEVDGNQLGITGASGGGNQSMYAGAFDERIKCVVPVCSVGNYQAYLSAACCMCEVVPGALRFTEEAGVLSLVAPRALMIINATRDSFQFSVGEAKKSIALAEPVFQLYEKPKHLRHTIFESGHDYSRPMREAMYGWMTMHLKGEGDGSPIPEPKHTTENPEDLRCFPGDSRPTAWLTIPKFVKREGEALLNGKTPTTPDELRRRLTRSVFGGFPPVFDKALPAGELRRTPFEPEPGVQAHLTVTGKADATQTVLFLSFDGAEATAKTELYQSLQKLGHRMVILEPRASGLTAYPRDKIGRAPDHTTAEWSLWLGRPLLGQWTFDVIRTLDLLDQDRDQKLENVTIVGEGAAALVAITAAALDDRLQRVVASGLLASFLSDEPIVGQRLGLLAPNIIPQVGDIPDLVQLVAPKKTLLLGPVHANGQQLTPNEWLAQFPKRNTLTIQAKGDALSWADWWK